MEKKLLLTPIPCPHHSHIHAIPYFFSRDHLRSPSGIISGPGSFAVQFGDPFRSGIICGPGIIFGPVQVSLTQSSLSENQNRQ